jgi:predicted TIM-barrel fold metal-dependent hydrolase
MVAGAAALHAAEAIVETHVHLFGDPQHFPGHPNGSTPKPATLEAYLDFARQAGISHAVHVSAEPYQDDHRYLEYTLQQAPKGFLKGTLLLDTTRDDTPKRLEEMARKYPGRIVALRLHCTRGRTLAPSTEGPIRDRDLDHPNVPRVWRKAGELGIAIQAHIQPYFAPQVEKLAAAHPDTRVILDHFGHAGTGQAERTATGWRVVSGEIGYRDPKEFDLILRLAKLRHVFLKVSSFQYSSLQPHPHSDLRPLVRKAFDAFGPDRMFWGSYGHTTKDLRQKEEVFAANFDFLNAQDRARIRAGTAIRFFKFG